MVKSSHELLHRESCIPGELYGKDFLASWHAFQPRRDENHETVFWMVKEDGFFISWDKAN